MSEDTQTLITCLVCYGYGDLEEEQLRATAKSVFETDPYEIVPSRCWCCQGAGAIPFWQSVEPPEEE